VTVPLARPFQTASRSLLSSLRGGEQTILAPSYRPCTVEASIPSEKFDGTSGKESGLGDVGPPEPQPQPPCEWPGDIAFANIKRY
jgi:hypothetical protein